MMTTKVIPEGAEIFVYYGDETDYRLSDGSVNDDREGWYFSRRRTPRIPSAGGAPAPFGGSEAGRAGARVFEHDARVTPS